MSSQTLISSLTWIPRGRAAPIPTRYELTDDELARVGKMGGEGVLEKLRKEMENMEVDDGMGGGRVGDDGDGDWEDEDGSDESGDEDGDVEMGDSKKSKTAGTTNTAPTASSDPNDLSAYNLDTYDDEVSRGAAMGAFSNIKGLSFYRDNNDDPYITLKDDHGDDNSEDERAALEVLPTDSLILTAKTSDDLSLLELHVYDEREENLWVRNDLMVPSMPLCVEWLDFPPSQAAAQRGHEEQAAKKTHGNYVAVGTFDTAIEVWDLDVLDGLYPTAILGPPPGLIPDVPPPAPTGTGKKKKRAQPPPPPAANDKHHTQSVISLSWTSAHRNLLLSSSADGSIKLWDLSRPSPMEAIKSWTHHQGEKVLAVEWNRFGVQGCGGPVGAKAEFSTVVLSAGERSVMVWDSRAVGGVVSTGRLGADVECVKWDPWNAMDFFVSLENGLILCYDARTLSSATSTGAQPQPKYTISAHDGPCTALDVNQHVRGCLATGGMDKIVKIWNVNEEQQAEGGKREISLVTSRDLGVGKVFTVKFSPDSPLTLAAGGSLAKLQLWDVSTNAGARSAFGPRLRQMGKELAEARKGSGGVIGVPDDDEASEDDEV